MDIFTQEPGTPRLQQALISVCLLQTRIHSQEQKLNTAPGNTTIRAAFTGWFLCSSDYLVFGSDDGSSEGTDTNSAILYSVNTHTGLLLDKMTSHGDIRSTIVYNNGYVYFTTKGGYLYRVQMNADGTFGSTSSYNLGGMATASPVVYKGRIYVGVCGNGGQYNGGMGDTILMS